MQKRGNKRNIHSLASINPTESDVVLLGTQQAFKCPVEDETRIELQKLQEKVGEPFNLD